MLQLISEIGVFKVVSRHKGRAPRPIESRERTSLSTTLVLQHLQSLAPGVDGLVDEGREEALSRHIIRIPNRDIHCFPTADVGGVRW